MSGPNTIPAGSKYGRGRDFIDPMAGTKSFRRGKIVVRERQRQAQSAMDDFDDTTDRDREVDRLVLGDDFSQTFLAAAEEFGMNMEPRRPQGGGRQQADRDAHGRQVVRRPTERRGQEPEQAPEPRPSRRTKTKPTIAMLVPGFGEVSVDCEEAFFSDNGDFLFIGTSPDSRSRLNPDEGAEIRLHIRDKILRVSVTPIPFSYQGLSFQIFAILDVVMKDQKQDDNEADDGEDSDGLDFEQEFEEPADGVL